MEPLATIEDYRARYGDPTDEARAATLLSDASDLLMSAYESNVGDYERGKVAAFDRSAAAVCCLVVNRVLSAPAALAGAMQYSQGAGGYRVVRVCPRRNVPGKDGAEAPRAARPAHRGAPTGWE